MVLHVFYIEGSPSSGAGPAAAILSESDAYGSYT